MSRTLLLKVINLFFVIQKVNLVANAIVLVPAVLVKVVLLKDARALIVTF